MLCTGSTSCQYHIGTPQALCSWARGWRLRAQPTEPCILSPFGPPFRAGDCFQPGGRSSCFSSSLGLVGRPCSLPAFPASWVCFPPSFPPSLHPSLSPGGCLQSCAAFKEIPFHWCRDWISWDPHHGLESCLLWPQSPAGAMGAGHPQGLPSLWDLSSPQGSRVGPLSRAWLIEPFMDLRGLGANLPCYQDGKGGF